MVFLKLRMEEMLEAAAGDALPSPPWKDVSRFRRLPFLSKPINVIVAAFFLFLSESAPINFAQGTEILKQKTCKLKEDFLKFLNDP